MLALPGVNLGSDQAHMASKSLSTAGEACIRCRRCGCLAGGLKDQLDGLQPDGRGGVLQQVRQHFHSSHALAFQHGGRGLVSVTKDGLHLGAEVGWQPKR